MKKQSLSRLFLILSVLSASAGAAGTLLAYLTDEDGPIILPLHLQYGTNFGITIYNAGDEDNPVYDLKEQILTPKQKAGFAPVIRNDGDYPVYTFIELISSDDRILNITSASNTWHQLDADAVEGKIIYAYGDAHRMEALQPDGDYTTELSLDISLEPDIAIEEENQFIQAVGYGIQTYGISNTDPEKVWKLLQSPQEEE